MRTTTDREKLPDSESVAYTATGFGLHRTVAYTNGGAKKPLADSARPDLKQHYGKAQAVNRSPAGSGLRNTHDPFTVPRARSLPG